MRSESTSVSKLDELSRTLAVQALAEAYTRVATDHKVYIPRGVCAELQHLTIPEVMISGPAGTGKSRACLEKIQNIADRYPGSRSLVIRKTRTSLTDTGLVTYERDVLGFDHPLVVDGPSRRYRHAYAFPNGSEIVTGGMDKPGRILSSEWDAIYVQQAEELHEADWETLMTRLRGTAVPECQVMGDCNPGAPRHWIKLREAQGAVPLLESRHEDNPLLWDMATGDWTPYGARYIAILDALTGVRLQRLRYGRWVQAEGVVFESFDRAHHLIDRFDIPDDWRRFLAIDFGHTEPFVCQWWAQDHDGVLYLYREIYMTKRIVRDHAAKIVEVTDAEQPFYIDDKDHEDYVPEHKRRRVRRPTATICDHDAEDRATLHAAGVPNTSANKDVLTGLDRVEERLRINPETQKARLYVMRDSLVETDHLLADLKRPTCTVDEFDSYIWENKRNKEQPVKEDDHGMDAMRYMVMHLDSGRPSGAGLVAV